MENMCWRCSGSFRLSRAAAGDKSCGWWCNGVLVHTTLFLTFLRLSASLSFAAARHSDVTRQPLRARQYVSADVWCGYALICGRCSNCAPGRLCVPAGRPAGPDTRARPWQLECSLPFAAARHSDLTRQPLRAHQYLSADVWCRSAPICGRCSNCSSGEPFVAHKTRSFSCTSTCRARAFYMNMGGRPARRARA